jgi:glyoxylase-like metal-dependent hydrolase (beta-lactamase superfamily II)
VPTDQPWFDVRRVNPGIHIIEESLQAEQVKSYLVEGSERAILIDTGCGVGDLRRLVEELTSLPVIVVNSHAHWDHIGSNHQFDEIWIHEAEADKLEEGVPNSKLRPAFQPDQLTGPLPEGVDPDTLTFPPTKATRRLVDGDRIDLGGRSLEVIHGPGHSPGGISLLDEPNGALFSTDVAYLGPLYVYSPDLLLTYLQSLSHLADLAPRLTAVYPSHGPSPISPSRLAEMRDLIASIVAGRKPDSQVEDMASYRTGEVGAYVWGTPAHIGRPSALVGED